MTSHNITSIYTPISQVISLWYQIILISHNVASTKLTSHHTTMSPPYHATSLLYDITPYHGHTTHITSHNFDDITSYSCKPMPRFLQTHETHITHISLYTTPAARHPSFMSIHIPMSHHMSTPHPHHDTPHTYLPYHLHITSHSHYITRYRVYIT